MAKAKIHTPPISGFEAFNTTKVNSEYWINPDTKTWMIGDQDTGITVTGSPGRPGNNPYIGSNGNWFIEGVDQGVPANGIVDLPSPARAEDIFPI